MLLLKEIKFRIFFYNFFKKKIFKFFIFFKAVERRDQLEEKSNNQQVRIRNLQENNARLHIQNSRGM